MHHILLALLDQERHGYAIMQAIEALTHGDMRLGPGTLYTSIRKLLDGGLIEESDERPDEDDERRRYYRISDSGREVGSGRNAPPVAARQLRQQACSRGARMSRPRDPRWLALAEPGLWNVLVAVSAGSAPRPWRTRCARPFAIDVAKRSGGKLSAWRLFALELFPDMLEQRGSSQCRHRIGPS